MSTGLADGQAHAAGDGEPAHEGPSEDELFEVLSNRRRRYALQVLTGAERVELGPLSEQVAAWENDKAEAAVTSAERKRVYTSLQQSHLPRLDDAGLVVFDKRAGTVEPTAGLDEYEVYLDVVRGDDIPWNEYYLGLSAVGVALIVAVAVDAYPFVLLPDVAWAAFVVVAFLASAIAHTFDATGSRLGVGEEPPEVRE